MAGLIVIQITNHDVKMLGGQYPNVSSCFQKKRLSGHDLKNDLAQGLLKMSPGLKQCVVVMPRNDALLKQMEFPSIDSKEIRRMVGLQIPMIVPFDDSQVLYQHHLIEIQDSGYGKVLTAVVLNNVIQKYADAFPSNTHSLSNIYLSIETLGEFINKFLKSFILQDDGTIFIFMGTYFAEAVVLKGQQVVFSYHIPFGRDDTDRAAGFAEELRRCINNFESQNGESIKKVFFHKDEIDIHQFKNMLGHDAEVETIDFFREIPEAVFTFIEKGDLDSSWAALLGCFYAPDHRNLMTFLPEGIHSSKMREQNKKILTGFVCSLAAVLIMSGVLFKSIFNKYDNYLGSIHQQIKQMEPRLENVQRQNQFVSMISERAASFSVVEMVKEIYQALPEDVSLLYLAMRGDRQFELQGTTSADQSLSQIQLALASSDIFQKVDLQYATKRKRFNTEYTEFKIIFEPVR